MGNFNSYQGDKEKMLGYGFLLAFNDIVFLSFSCFLAYYLRFFTKFFGSSKPTYLIDGKYLFYSFIFIAFFIVISAAIRLYNIKIIYSNPTYYLKMLVPPIAAVIITVIFGRLYERFPFSRLWIASLIILSLFFFIASRYVVALITKKFVVSIGIKNIKVIAGIGDNLIAIQELPRLKKKFVYGIILLISDVISLALSFFLSYYIRFNTGELAEIKKVYIIEENYFMYSIVFIISALFLFLLFNLYDRIEFTGDQVIIPGFLKHLL